MKEIRLGARLSAYSKVTGDSLTIAEMTYCDVDKMFGESCEKCQDVASAPNEVTCADIDNLFK